MPKVKYIKIILYFILIIFIGPVMFIYAGYDDSPGGQLIGVIVSIIGIIGIIRTKRKVSHLDK
jgi:hypothetical protein